MRFLVGLLIIVLSVTGCSKADKSAGGSAEMEKSEPSVESDISRDNAPLEQQEDSSISTIDTRAVLPALDIDERLLEYNINLVYNSRDVLSSRIRLFNIISRYGFLLNSNTYTDTESPYMNVSFKAKTGKLYDMLTELNEIGILKNETVSVTDMTGDEIYRHIQEKREILLTKRREEALLNYNLSTKNYEQREQMLENSENRLDEVEYQLWQLEDRAEWSVVSVSIYSPQKAVDISVPSFYNAFIYMINGVLIFVYGIIRFIPLVIILIVVVIFRERIFKFFKKKKKTGE